MSELLLSVDTPETSVDLVVDGAAPLAVLLPALAGAVGVSDPAGWTWWDGLRPLPTDTDTDTDTDPAPHAGWAVSLDALGLLSGSRLRLLPR